ncbi:T9SS C-terminal target domain-containing protein [Bacteroidetes/Chlorobi group bacterium ChocPot_Mid]|nr:MAG: T9SS C-terminal target domain-containing protein [Bacteroidetes/Chlorobi group bacterium ChocPot_Mid]
MLKKLLIATLFAVFSINFANAEINVKNIFSTNKLHSTGIIQSDNKNNKISPLTHKLINDLKSANSKSENLLNKKNSPYLLRKIDNNIFVGALIKVTDNFNIQNLIKSGIKIGSKAGNIISIKIPIEKLEMISNLENIYYLQIDEKVTPKMDKVRTDIRSNQVNSGEGLSKAYKGSNVVVGIIDGGYDFTHINFLREDGSEYRIMRVWNQWADSGTPPDGFSYGAELSTTNAILNEQTDALFDSHGSHVAGIIAGSGYRTNGKWKGVAPDADLVLVSMGESSGEIYNTGQSEIIDGINYIFKTAESLGKPAVINMSLGVHIGPHDGTSLFDEACDALTGPGKIIVGSAGNEGDVPLHLSYTFTPQNNNLHTIMYIEELPFEDYDEIGITDIWGETGKNFNLVVSLVNPNTSQLVSSEIYSTTQSDYQTFYLTGSDSKQCSFSIYTSNSEFNGKSRIFIDVTKRTNDFVMLSINANEGTIHMWNHGTGSGSPFMGDGVTLLDGNTDITVGEIGGTGKSIITVGAYCSKTSFTNLDGELIENEHTKDNITSYSSKGPTVDGRIKPEVTAPGSFVVSSVNSFDISMKRDGYESYSLADESTIDGNYTWYYAGMEGTSMSSPVVAGVVALLLESKPYLTPNDIKNILKVTSRKDAFTGNLPPEGNNTWGFGKVDAFAAVNYTETDVNDNSIFTKTFNIFPNPAKDYVYLSYPNELLITDVTVHDVLGNIVLKEGDLNKPINIESLNQSVYFITITTRNNTITKPLYIVK